MRTTSGSTTHSPVLSFQYASEDTGSDSVMVRLSPGARCTRAYPRRSFLARVTARPACWTYSCTTSSPGRWPPFVMSTLTRTVSRDDACELFTLTSEYVNVV